METKPASKRQMAYIRRLRLEMGEAPRISEELSASEASEMISELISRAQEAGHPVVQRKINEPRLGMAMKESFRVWTGLGWSVYDKRRKAFIDYAIDTYQLFSEIAERLETRADAQQNTPVASLSQEQVPEAAA